MTLAHAVLLVVVSLAGLPATSELLSTVVVALLLFVGAVFEIAIPDRPVSTSRCARRATR